METTKKKASVAPLKKTALVYTAGSTENAADLVSTPQPVEFIFGLGVDGLSDFEYHLEGKTVGEKLQYRLQRSRLEETFGHLLPLMEALPSDIPEFYLHVEITAVSEASQRQLVKALAEGASCGCGCGCGLH